MVADFSFFIFPISGSSSPSINLNNVVFPDPFFPTRPALIPAFITILTFEKRIPEEYDFEMFSK